MIMVILKYLVWFGVALISTGLTIGIVSGSWGSAATAFLIAGAVAIGIWLLFLGRLGDPNRPGFWQRRSTQASTNAFVGTLAVFVMLGLINFVAVRNPQKFDLTENKIYTLATETQDVMKQLKQPVKLYLFDKDRNPQDVQILDQMKAASKQFNYEYIDPETNPTQAKRFEIKNDPNNHDVYVERGDRRQFVQTLNPQVRLQEPFVVNAVLKASLDRDAKVYFLQGHGERVLEQGQFGLSEALKVLDKRSLKPEPLNLAQLGKVPDDASVIVIAGAKQPLLEAEVKAIQEYQAKGGNLFLLVDPKTNPGVKPILDAWGLVLDQRFAIDASEAGRQLGSNPATPVVQTYNNHPITQRFGKDISFYPGARPIEIRIVDGVQANPIVLTAKESWAESNIEEKPVKLSEGDRPGPLPIGVALSRVVTPQAIPSPVPSVSPTASPSVSPSATPSPKPSATPATDLRKESRMVVFGNSSFATDGYFGQYLNGDVFVNSVSWLSQNDGQVLSVRPRSAKNRRLMITNEQMAVVGLIALAGLPLLGLITAGVIWAKQR
jgi:ABC-type uncharacterized transport system involved in gliding motility auxiliary subunit